MDIASHFLWTNLAGRAAKQGERTSLWLAVFGITPDFFAFGYNFTTQAFGKLNLAQVGNAFHLQQASMPKITFALFNISHSFIVFFAVLVIITILKGRLWVPVLGWGAHILIDIPTHSASFFPPPFMYPFHSPIVNGISWANPYFMLIDFFLLFFIYHELHLKKHTTKLFRKIFKRLA